MKAPVNSRELHDLVPFNVQPNGNDIVVTYVLHQESNMVEPMAWPGLYMDIFSTDGLGSKP
jgi:hypothetical protein